MGTGSNPLASSVGYTKSILKSCYKSTPEMKNHFKINDEWNGTTVKKENFHSNNLNIKNSTTANFNRKLTPQNPKNAHVNLWRKPVIVGNSNLNIANSSNSNFNSANSNLSINLAKAANKINLTPNINDKKLNKGKTVNTGKTLDFNSNFSSLQFKNSQILTNMLTTTETKKDDKEKETNFTNNFTNSTNLNTNLLTSPTTTEPNSKNQQTSTPIQRYIEPEKCKNTSKYTSGYGYKNKKQSIKIPDQQMYESNEVRYFGIDENDYVPMEKKNTNNVQINYMANYNTNINLANNPNLQSEILSSIINFKTLLKSNETTSNLEDRLMKSEENITKINQLNSKLNMYGGGFGGTHPGKKEEVQRDIKNRNVNVINADMLGDDIFAKPKVEVSPSRNPTPNTNKNKMLNEIHANSDMRIKRYEILLDFISSNLKEINQIVNNSHVNIQSQNNGEVSRDKFDNSYKMSSLHSKINLNSHTNLYMEDFEEDKMNFLSPRLKEELNFNEQADNKRKVNQIYEPSPSFLISSINSEFYQNLIEGSYCNNNCNLNFPLDISNDTFMSSFRTQNEQTKKLDKFFQGESDKTTIQYSNKKSNKNLIPGGEIKSHYNHRSSDKENKVHANKGDDCDVAYNEGEENIEDSDLDKTMEKIQNQMTKDIERVKLFKTSVSPDEKSSKCVIF